MVFFENPERIPVSPRSFVKKKNGKRHGRTFFPKSKNPFKHDVEYFCGFKTSKQIRKTHMIDIKIFLIFIINFISFAVFSFFFCWTKIIKLFKIIL